MTTVARTGERKGGGPNEFGRLVRDRRKVRGMSQERLAEVADLSGGYISLIESGGRGQRPSRDTVIAIAQALGEDPVEFLRAAGRLEPADESVGQEAFDRLVTSDPRLRADQKRILIGIYRSYVGRQR